MQKHDWFGTFPNLVVLLPRASAIYLQLMTVPKILPVWSNIPTTDEDLDYSIIFATWRCLTFSHLRSA